MTLDDLYATIEARKGADPDSSWTAKLLAIGPLFKTCAFTRLDVFLAPLNRPSGRPDGAANNRAAFSITVANIVANNGARDSARHRTLTGATLDIPGGGARR